MQAIRRPTRACALGIVCFGLLWALGCASQSPSSGLLAPSPIIIPDAVTMNVGAAQVFSVQNAPVVSFDVTADGQNWSECVALDQTFVQANSIRLIALNRCRGLVYVVARITDNRSGLASVVLVQ